MGLFSKKNKEDDEHLKVNRRSSKMLSGEVHDPVLTAVHESQPYEVSTQNPTQAISPSGALRDVYGMPIQDADISNPARARNERPLDTIRAFEYSTTGDEQYRDMQESQRLGFRPRQEFSSMPVYETNPYANDSNVISFGDPAAAPESKREVYYPPVPESHKVEKKKKKKGMFSRKSDE